MIAMLFPVEIQKSGLQFIASFPDVFGANARGDTKALALKGAEEALRLRLAEMYEDNEPFPQASPIPDGGVAVVAPFVWKPPVE